ncbi:hypothetical protein PYW07_014846 [Mythimna separata]|uniref:Uncharacterized protein n=1 Tax=Mythimna separata TaxID=271217 RepID=A0AAD7Z0J1_MYTSE|nr:hypothetical protein PYW07_014846 [Mythimna separata]
MSEQKKNINCRVCIRYDLEKSQKCLSLFEEYNNSLIAEKIKYVANIEIKESDGLPSRICPDCLLQLETAVVFKQKCETSNKILLSIVKQPSKICRIAFKVPVKNEVDVVFENRTEPGTTKPEISRKGTEQLEVPHVEKSTNKTSLTKKDVNKKSEITRPVNVIPVNLIPKDEEPDYEISDGELVIDTAAKEEIEIKNLENEDVNQDPGATGNLTATGKPSRAIDLKLICDDCGGSFKSKCKLAVHWKNVHLLSKLVCPSCKRQFKTFKAFNIHKKKQSMSCRAASKVRIEGLGKKRVFHCKDCVYSTRRIKDMDAHLVIHSGLRPYQCKDCLKCFTQHASLQGHRESSHKEYRVVSTCQYCGKIIKGRNQFYKHLRQHTPKSVQCEVCKKILKSRDNLANHMKRHTGVRGYTCETCSANFYTMGELCNHRKRVHDKSKSFKCDMCEYTAFTAGLLKTHKSRHTASNVVCLECGFFFENAEKLAIHQKRHDEKNFSCPECDKSFFRRDSLRRHILKKHGEPKKLANFVITLNPVLS